ncbi:uncharacterized protein LOC132714696 [Ruditapes philippinarum]|uniref:uncharacterized protein LOC132714696 n=1 Tax=Ruditapes philippinarum TaxID=129788 RepID=UPI00295AD514|nr:uncharacterized protein LOC132714696 [Ruditapes philippinarum]
MGTRLSNPCEKTTLYWLDKIDDNFSTDIHKTLTEKIQKTFQQYTIKRIDNIALVTEKQASIIIICRITTCRLEHMLDSYLENVEESIFEKVLVIIVHDNSPHLSSKLKLGDSGRYKKLENVIDVSYKNVKLFESLRGKKNVNIIFGEELFHNFLRDSNDLKSLSREETKSNMNKTANNPEKDEITKNLENKNESDDDETHSKSGSAIKCENSQIMCRII